MQPKCVTKKLEVFSTDNTAPSYSHTYSRRTILKTAALTLAGTFLIPKFSFASPLKESERNLHLYQPHTGEFLKTTYWAEGAYVPEGLQALNRFLRDFRTNKLTSIDPALLNTLNALALTLDATQPLHIVSAYRCPTTNAALRKKSKGVAKHSFHTKGRAVDIRIPKIPLKKIHLAALKLQSGGVGYYPHSNFVHVDTGPVRKWAGS